MSSEEILYGVNPIRELLRSKSRICKRIYILDRKGSGHGKEIEREIASLSIPIVRVQKQELQKIANTDKNQGIAALVEPFRYADADEIMSQVLSREEKGLLLVLDGITDPQNLGSIVRTAYLLGVQGIFLPKDRSSKVTAAVVKASAGATEYMPISLVTNLHRVLSTLKERGFWVFGADSDASGTIYDRDFVDVHVVVVLGSEGAGMRRLVRETCDEVLSIPMRGELSSFNASVAGALFLGEIARQRRKKDACKIHT